MEPFEISKLEENTLVVSKILKIIANPHRLMILCLLLEGEKNVGDLNSTVSLSQSAFSQHLTILKQTEMIIGRKKAQKIYYRIKDENVYKIMESLHKLFC